MKFQAVLFLAWCFMHAVSGAIIVSKVGNANYEWDLELMDAIEDDLLERFSGPFDNTFSNYQCSVIKYKSNMTIIQCLSWCEATYPACTAVNFNERHNEGSCVLRNCPLPVPHPIGSENDRTWKGYSKIIKWHPNLQCGPKFPLSDGKLSQCDPRSEFPCCSKYGWCGNTRNHCRIGGSQNYRACPKKSTCNDEVIGKCKDECSLLKFEEDTGWGCAFNGDYCKKKCCTKICILENTCKSTDGTAGRCGSLRSLEIEPGEREIENGCRFEGCKCYVKDDCPKLEGDYCLRGDCKLPDFSQRCPRTCMIGACKHLAEGI